MSLNERCAAQVEVQRAHAHAQGQGALADGALETALGRFAPGGMQVLQRVEAQPCRDGQGPASCRCFCKCASMACDQRLRVEPEQTLRCCSARNLAAVTRPDVDVRRDGKQVHRPGLPGCSLIQFAPGLQHFGEPGDLVLAQLIAACGCPAAGRRRRSVRCSASVRLAGQLVAQAQVLQLMRTGDPIQLMQFQPQRLPAPDNTARWRGSAARSGNGSPVATPGPSSGARSLLKRWRDRA